MTTTNGVALLPKPEAFTIKEPREGVAELEKVPVGTCIGTRPKSIQASVEGNKASRMNFNYHLISSPTHVTENLFEVEWCTGSHPFAMDYKLQPNTAALDHQTKSKTRRGNLHLLPS